MPAISIKKIYFAPAVAVARLGASPVPLEAFTWVEDPSSFGSGQTVIVPLVSLQILADGSVDPYLPGHLQFKDEGMIRPVCPFFELHATWKGAGESGDEPLTPTLLYRAGLKLAALSFLVKATNRKAAHRTGDEACAFEARGLFQAVDHAKRELRAYSRASNGTPLVLQDHSIPLGNFQVIRPGTRGQERLGVKLDTIRVRFTPAKGEVYGPPLAKEGQTNDSRTRHTIVPAQNRILNPDANWPRYSPIADSPPPSQPADTYDGESDIDRAPSSWGVVDDTCEVVITAQLATRNIISANARVLVSPPHYAPDRRPFYSMVDELADRDPQSVRTPDNLDELQASVVDLFRRILETASLINVERQRSRAIGTNRDARYTKVEGFPAIDETSMSLKDNIAGVCFLSDLAQSDLKGDAGRNSSGDVELTLSELAREQHQELADPEYLISFLLQNKERFAEIVRPPFARLNELRARPKPHSLQGLRDPRNSRDLAHDMRMPPYMRDSDFSALSITRRQWQQIEELLAQLKKDRAKPDGDTCALSGADSRAKAYQIRKKGVKK
jgi:hypothetical protein